MLSCTFFFFYLIESELFLHFKCELTEHLLFLFLPVLSHFCVFFVAGDIILLSVCVARNYLYLFLEIWVHNVFHICEMALLHACDSAKRTSLRIPPILMLGWYSHSDCFKSREQSRQRVWCFLDFETLRQSLSQKHSCLLSVNNGYAWQIVYHQLGLYFIMAVLHFLLIDLFICMLFVLECEHVTLLNGVPTQLLNEWVVSVTMKSCCTPSLPPPPPTPFQF